jgi:nicotinamide-nucleotide amidase
VTDQQAAPAGCLLAALPGVPAEMKIMFADHVVPRLTASGMVVDRTQIRTFGLGESEVEQRLGDLTARGRNPEVGITASEAVITLSITARAGSAAECQRMIDPVRQQIEQLLGPAVFGMGESDLHECLAAELRRAGLRIACLEGAATGGLIAHWLCDTDEHEQFLTEARFLPAPRNGTGSDAATEAAAAWDRWFREVAANQLAAENVDFVVLTSSKWDSETPGGVRRRHGYVAVAGAGFFEMHDVTMSGNLSIFRGRAARTALNCLRLNAIS